MLALPFALLLGAAASASTYDLNLEMTVGERSPTKARVRVTPGKVTSIVREIDGDRVFVDVSAEENRAATDGEKAVLLRFVVGTLSGAPGPKNERQVLARPSIKAIEDERALLSENHVSIAVTARPL